MNFVKKCWRVNVYCVHCSFTNNSCSYSYWYETLLFFMCLCVCVSLVYFNLVLFVIRKRIKKDMIFIYICIHIYVLYHSRGRVFRAWQSIWVFFSTSICHGVRFFLHPFCFCFSSIWQFFFHATLLVLVKKLIVTSRKLTLKIHIVNISPAIDRAIITPRTQQNLPCLLHNLTLLMSYYSDAAAETDQQSPESRLLYCWWWSCCCFAAHCLPIEVANELLADWHNSCLLVVVEVRSLRLWLLYQARCLSCPRCLHWPPVAN